MERTRAAYYTALAKLQANSFQSGWPSTKDMAALVLTIAGTIGSAWVAPPGELGILDLARENVENPPPPRRIRREVTDGGTAT